MTTRERSLLFVACVAMAAMGYIVAERRVLHGRDDATAVVSYPDTREMVAPRSPATSTHEQAAPAAGSESRYAELARRAEAGERDAATELANLLTRCAGVNANQREVISLTMMLDPETRHFGNSSKDFGSSALRARLDEAQARLDANRTACAGTTKQQVETRAHWLYRAGELGDAQAALEFGEGTFLYPDMFDQLDQIPFWRDHAQEMLESAMRGGKHDAVLILARAYDPDPTFRADFPPIRTDPVSAYAYYYLLSSLADIVSIDTEGALARLGGDLSDAERQQATELAARLCAEDLPQSTCNFVPATSP